MPFSIDVAVTEPGWTDALDAPEPFVRRAVEAGAALLDETPEGELSVALVSDTEIADLNTRFRDRDGPTNVLSFPGSGPVQGDIVLALQTCLRECSKQNKTVEAHTAHLLVHGFLHLHGHTHAERAERLRMEALERDALATLGHPDPYVLAPHSTRASLRER